MEFGNVPPEELPGIDFTLPDDPKMTRATLQSSNRMGDLKVYVGCTTWSQKPWVGILYPVGTKVADFGTVYAHQFNTIEFGPTFYAMPRADEVRPKWTAKVEGSPDFKFCLRFPTKITHIRKLKNAESLTAQFFDSLVGFGNHLGSVLIQVGEAFSYKYYDTLKSFIEQLPKGYSIFLEVRNKDWFANQNSRDQLFNLLQQHNIGAVISDTPGRRDAVHMQLPTPHAMIRFVGNNGQPVETARLDAWLERLKEWNDQGLQSLWFFVHQHDERYAPYSCRYLIRELNEKLGLNVSEPIMHNELETGYELMK